MLAGCRASYLAGHLEGSIIGGLIRDCHMGASLAPHIMLAVMWAALANTVPAVFWSVAFLLQPEHLHHRRTAVEPVSGRNDMQDYAQVQEMSSPERFSASMMHRPALTGHLASS